MGHSFSWGPSKYISDMSCIFSFADHQGSEQRWLPAGQHRLPTGFVPRCSLHHYRHRCVCGGSGSSHCLPFETRTHIAAAPSLHMPLGSPGGEQAPLGNGIAPADLEESFLGMYSFSLRLSLSVSQETGERSSWGVRREGTGNRQSFLLIQGESLSMWSPVCISFNLNSCWLYPLLGWIFNFQKPWQKHWGEKTETTTPWT